MSVFSVLQNNTASNGSSVVPIGELPKDSHFSIYLE